MSSPQRRFGAHGGRGRRGFGAEAALLEARAHFEGWLTPRDLGALSTTGTRGLELAVGGPWAHWCVRDFGSGCIQYLLYLGVLAAGGWDTSPLAAAAKRGRTSSDGLWPLPAPQWRTLYNRLACFHRRLALLRGGPGGSSCSRDSMTAVADGSHVEQVRLWDQLAQAGPRIVQDGHLVVFCGDEGEMRAVPTGNGHAHGCDAVVPPGFLDLAPVAPLEVVGVRPDLALERWRLVPGASPERLLRAEPMAAGVKERLYPADILESQVRIPPAVRLFVEHVAGLVFIFIGCVVQAFDLATLELAYAVVHRDRAEEQQADDDEAGDVEFLARWDYGRAFLVYRADGPLVSVWSTASGSSRGHLTAVLALLCCDLTWAEVGGAGAEPPGAAVLVTLEVDGQIRAYREDAPCSWRQFAAVAAHSGRPLEVFVEVKLERGSLVAASHTEDGDGGTVHLWDLTAAGVARPRKRRFPRPPDRIELRHGGVFVEVCFAPDQPSAWPTGISNIAWLDSRASDLRPFVELEHAVGDWRCDIRDRLAIASHGGKRLLVAPMWPPLA